MPEYPQRALIVGGRWGKAGYFSNAIAYQLNGKQNLKTKVSFGWIVVLGLTFIWINFIFGRNKSEKFDSKEGDARFPPYKRRGAKRTTADLFPPFPCNNIYLL